MLQICDLNIIFRKSTGTKRRKTAKKNVSKVNENVSSTRYRVQKKKKILDSVAGTTYGVIRYSLNLS